MFRPSHTLNSGIYSDPDNQDIPDSNKWSKRREETWPEQNGPAGRDE